MPEITRAVWDAADPIESGMGMGAGCSRAACYSPREMHRTRPLLLALLLTACGGSHAEPTDDEVTDEATTSGGETETEPAPEPVMRATVPVPVPQPAVAREALTEPLQNLWTGVEETVAIRPPEPPEEDTTEAANAWAQGPFAEWMGVRASSMRSTIELGEGVAATPPYERAVAAALLAYALEDFVADVRGAPVPASIATDPELLEVYVGSMNDTVRPLAVEAVTYYAFCTQRLTALGDDSPWLPWRAYCTQRGQEMIELYELQPPGEEGDATAPPPPGDTKRR